MSHAFVLLKLPTALPTAMQFTKQSFMGIELDILVGHPEHDILFIATQVARAAGLKNPSVVVSNFRAYSKTVGTRVAELGKEIEGIDRKMVKSTSLMFSEAATYQMLLRGHAPASEPFRKWVTEEVLPFIRKTGAYNVNESTTKEGQQFAGELAALHAKLSRLEGMLQQLMDRPTAAVGASSSPYEGTAMSSSPMACCSTRGPTERWVNRSAWGVSRWIAWRIECGRLDQSNRQAPDDANMMASSVPLPVNPDQHSERSQ